MEEGPDRDERREGTRALAKQVPGTTFTPHPVTSPPQAGRAVRAPLSNPHFIVPHFLPPHRALLGLYLPGVLTEALVSALPAELGAYVATSSEPIRISGELRVLGQQVSGSDLYPDLAIGSSPAL